MVDHYATHNKSFEVVKKITPVYLKFLILNFYSDKLVPDYYFFNAQEEKLDKDHLWENYVNHGLSYELSGAHIDDVNQENSIKIMSIITK
mgnify:CR=1 FL=1